MTACIEAKINTVRKTKINKCIARKHLIFNFIHYIKVKNNKTFFFKSIYLNVLGINVPEIKGQGKLFDNHRICLQKKQKNKGICGIVFEIHSKCNSFSFLRDIK